MFNNIVHITMNTFALMSSRLLIINAIIHKTVNDIVEIWWEKLFEYINAVYQVYQVDRESFTTTDSNSTENVSFDTKKK